MKKVWPEAWHGQKPHTSRLLHGAGIQAMGDVMEVLAERDEAGKVRRSAWLRLATSAALPERSITPPASSRR